jgi:branched-chain amino acid transport system ATP-binding protein
MLRVEGLEVRYGGVLAVQGIDLDVPEGRVTTVLGANGAGKSSTLKAIAGTVRPAAGRVLLEGEDVTGTPAHRLLAKGVALIPEGGRVFGRLSVEQNLMIGAYLVRDEDIRRSKMEEVLALFPVLAERRRQVAGTLSGGERQMLAIGRALMSGPRAILIDEPSLGLAPVIVDHLFDTLRTLRERGVTVLLVEQNVGLALELADYGYVLQTGRVALQGSPQELMESEHVRKAYLGL